VRDRDRATWSEEDSGIYRDIAPIAVPERAEMLAALLCLIPFAGDEPFGAVDLGCGDGLLASVFLDCYPAASITALDRSEDMLDAARRRLRRFGERARVRAFDLSSSEWLPALDDTGCVLSSLALHHLRGDQKRRLFAETSRRISPRGALLMADIVEPQAPGARDLFAATWDRAAGQQARSVGRGEDLIDKFERAEWNYYRFPDPADTPSGLFEQLTWMNDAGFRIVDCFWMRAGHAVYGGYKSQPGPTPPSPTFATILDLSFRALDAFG
jgi:tRNA (cmo5U34)-methyltransferase